MLQRGQLPLMRHTKNGRSTVPPDDPAAIDFSLALTIERFEKSPPHIQQETRERVSALLLAEYERGQVHHSVLWRSAKAVYGIDPLDIVKGFPL